LAFHPYPQVIQLLCNAGRFGPPVRITGPSACPWVAHPVSGLLRATRCAHFRLAFAPAPRRQTLNLATHSNSPAHSSIGTPSPDVCTPAATACRHAVSGTVSLPSRGAFHLSLTVLVHYRLTRVFSLGVWSPQLPTRLPLARGTQVLQTGRLPVAYGTLTPLVGRSRTVRLRNRFITRCHQRRCSPSTPAQASLHRFGLLPLRSPLLRESSLLLGVLRCFSSPGCR
jgi:hypothetical protein